MFLAYLYLKNSFNPNLDLLEVFFQILYFDFLQGYHQDVHIFYDKALSRQSQRMTGDKNRIQDEEKYCFINACTMYPSVLRKVV